MSARARTYLVVGLAAVAAAGLVVGAVAVTRTSTPHRSPNAQPRPPTLVLDLGVRTDAEAVALRRANRLYAAGRRREAGEIFGRYRSVEARVGAALAAWPSGTLPRLETLAREHPSSAPVLLHLGLTQLASGRPAAARSSWRRAVARDPDTASAVHADDLLHPQFAPGLPAFVPSFPPPPAIARLAPPAQLAALRRGADVRSKLLYGSALQRLGRPDSAEREFTAARRLSPGSLEARVAAIVGSFSKANPAGAFSRLGPLAGRYPRSQTVRFHLGELLLWIGQVKEAKRQLRLARAAGRETDLGRTADSLLKRLATFRTE